MGTPQGSRSGGGKGDEVMNAEDMQAKRNERWAHKMDLARQLANLHQARMRIECKTWDLADGAVKREYLLRNTGVSLWAVVPPVVILAPPLP